MPIVSLRINRRPRLALLDERRRQDAEGFRKKGVGVLRPTTLVLCNEHLIALSLGVRRVTPVDL